MKKKKKLLR